MLANLPTKLIDPSSRGQPPLNNVHCLVLNVVAAFLLGWPFPACFFLCVSVCGGYFPAWFFVGLVARPPTLSQAFWRQFGGPNLLGHCDIRKLTS